MRVYSHVDNLFTLTSAFVLFCNDKTVANLNNFYTVETL